MRLLSRTPVAMARRWQPHWLDRMRLLHEPVVPLLVVAGAVILSAKTVAAEQPAAADTEPRVFLEFWLVDAPRLPDPVLPMPPVGVSVTGVWGRYGFVLDGQRISTGALPDEVRRLLRRSNDAHVAERTRILARDGARSDFSAALPYWGGGQHGGTVPPRARIAVTPHLAASDGVRLNLDVAVYARQWHRGEWYDPPRVWASESTVVIFRPEQTVAFETVANLFVIVTAHVIRDDSDLSRAFERAMREREEDLDHALLFLHPAKLAPLRIGRRSRGLLGDIRLTQERNQAGTP
jgi:hypothetical protein